MNHVNTTPFEAADLQPLFPSFDVAVPPFHIREILEADVLRLINAHKTSKEKNVYEIGFRTLYRNG